MEETDKKRFAELIAGLAQTFQLLDQLGTQVMVLNNRPERHELVESIVDPVTAGKIDVFGMEVDTATTD